MFNLTTPKAILIGFFMVAISIAFLPYSNGVFISDAHAYDDNLSDVVRALKSIDRSISLIMCS